MHVDVVKTVVIDRPVAGHGHAAFDSQVGSPAHRSMLKGKAMRRISHDAKLRPCRSLRADAPPEALMIDWMLTHRAAAAALMLVPALLLTADTSSAERQRVAVNQSFVVPPDVSAAITKVSEAWLDAFERGDAETLAGLFTGDGLYAANTGQVLRGRDGIREGVLGWLDRRVEFLAAVGLPVDSRIDVEERVLRFRTAGDAVYRLSRFIIRVEPSGCAMDAGHVLSIWRQQPDNSWRIESILGNRDVEPPEDSCGRQRKSPKV